MGSCHFTPSRTYVHEGPDTVSAAAELMDLLPNGWVLQGFTYDAAMRCWVAVVEGRMEVP